ASDGQTSAGRNWGFVWKRIWSCCGATRLRPSVARGLSNWCAQPKPCKPKGSRRRCSCASYRSDRRDQYYNAPVLDMQRSLGGFVARLYKFSPKKSSVPLRPMDRLHLTLIGMGVVFADRDAVRLSICVAYHQAGEENLPGSGGNFGADQPHLESQPQDPSCCGSDCATPYSGGAAGDSGDSRRGGSYRVGAGRYPAAMISRPLSRLRNVG